VPLSYETDGSGTTALKRYAAQLADVARQAGFGEPAAELQAKLQEAAAGAPCARMCAHSRGETMDAAVDGGRVNEARFGWE
jgi:hypothetical protein